MGDHMDVMQDWAVTAIMASSTSCVARTTVAPQRELNADTRNLLLCRWIETNSRFIEQQDIQ
ncbi:hypothetical protein [Nocardia sp. NPDC005998]|uniref:hypothetical protein n=1 Tax=Nocardia sp. NPDC005998 TaxID=3156894 RepID=UPI0033B7E52F